MPDPRSSGQGGYAIEPVASMIRNHLSSESSHDRRTRLDDP